MNIVVTAEEIISSDEASPATVHHEEVAIAVYRAQRELNRR